MTDNLIRFRVKKDISILKMAKLLGISPDYYAKIEYNKRNPSYNFLCKFKTVFPEASIDELFFKKVLDETSKN